MAYMYLDPTSTILDEIGDNPYTCLNDGVRVGGVPTGGTTATEIRAEDKNDKLSICSYGTSDTTAVTDGEVDRVRLVMYESGQGLAWTDFDLRWNNVWQGGHSNANNVPDEDDWYYWQWNGPVGDSLSSVIENMGFRLKSPNMVNGNNADEYSGAYIEIEYSIVSGRTGPGGVAQLNSPFLLFVD